MAVVIEFAAHCEHEVSIGRRFRFGRNWKQVNGAPAEVNEILVQRATSWQDLSRYERRLRSSSPRLHRLERHCTEERQHNYQPTLCRVHCGGKCEFVT
jgi:hypothetical protein